jgi:hypothetical protein
MLSEGTVDFIPKPNIGVAIPPQNVNIVLGFKIVAQIVCRLILLVGFATVIMLCYFCLGWVFFVAATEINR